RAAGGSAGHRYGRRTETHGVARGAGTAVGRGRGTTHGRGNSTRPDSRRIAGCHCGTLAQPRRGGDPVIQTYELTKKYRRNEALRGLNLNVQEGSVFALVGANGAGKSTAIKTLMNIVQPTSGRADVMGVDSRKIGADQLAQIGYVSENQKLPEW